MAYSDIVIWFVVILTIIEIFFFSWTVLVRKEFQWLITTRDEAPKLSKDGLKKFIPKGYDSELGWVRKPNTSNSEKGKFGDIVWSINDKGSRINPRFEELESKISCYGDSFTFCRQVKNDETWGYFLSKLQKTNVLNFGVGNYGIDQSILRVKLEYPKNRTEIVILGVVPDTISRISSLWKHYCEYGNTFAFKPKFKLIDDNLVLIKNKIDDETKFDNYQKFIPEIQMEDFFYKEKFKKEIIKFPYTYFVLKNFKRNMPILVWVTITSILKKFGKDTKKIEWNAMKIIMRINLSWRTKLFKNKESIRLLEKLIEDFVNYANSNNFKPIFIFLPQKDDILFIKKNYNFYEEFSKKLSSLENLSLIDVTNDLLKFNDIDSLYSDDNEYGGHYSKIGNEKIALIINQQLINKKLI